MNVTGELANFVASASYDELPENVKEHAKLCVMDWIGCALAGSSEAPAKILVSIIREMGRKKESNIIDTRIKTYCVNAALANGTSSHAVELDDIHEKSIIHPAAPVVPTALATAGRNHKKNENLIAFRIPKEKSVTLRKNGSKPKRGLFKGAL